MSCGPFHAAAISNDGRLFTWGDGLFGKLGHGDHESCSSPRQIAALAEHWTISVSCGWWHSAAAALPRSVIGRDGGGSSSSSIGSSITATPSSSCRTSADDGAPPLRHSSSGNNNSRQSPFARAGAQAAAPLPPQRSSSGRGIASRPNSGGGGGCLSRGASSILGEVGGGLFTWGGDFTWQQRGKRDHHEGCLGLGDLAGRLLPTMVKGEDDIKQVRQQLLMLLFGATTCASCTVYISGRSTRSMLWPAELLQLELQLQPEHLIQSWVEAAAWGLKRRSLWLLHLTVKH